MSNTLGDNNPGHRANILLLVLDDLFQGCVKVHVTCDLSRSGLLCVLKTFMQFTYIRSVLHSQFVDICISTPGHPRVLFLFCL